VELGQAFAASGAALEASCVWSSSDLRAPLTYPLHRAVSSFCQWASHSDRWQPLLESRDLDFSPLEYRLVWAFPK
jgi:hypothetical protein